MIQWTAPIVSNVSRIFSLFQSVSLRAASIVTRFNISGDKICTDIYLDTATSSWPGATLWWGCVGGLGIRKTIEALDWFDDGSMLDVPAIHYWTLSTKWAYVSYSTCFLVGMLDVRRVCSTEVKFGRLRWQQYPEAASHWVWNVLHETGVTRS